MDNKKIGVGFGVMILNGEKILLGQRHLDPEKADSELHGEGTWTMPGGKLNFGESFQEGAAREVLEETGLGIEQNNLKLIALNEDKASDAHFITIGFLYDKEVGTALVMEPDEIISWEWFSLGNLPSHVFPPSQKIINNYLQGKIYIK
jgi:8-oxo-dGTP diphosphatase